MSISFVSGDPSLARDIRGPNAKSEQALTDAQRMLTMNQSAATKEQAELAQKQFGLARRQFEADLDLRNQLLGYLGISGVPSQPGSPEAGGGLFREWLGRQEGQRGEYMGLLNGFGESFRQDITDRYDTSLNNALGNLESRGLGGSSLAGVAHAANERERGRELLSLEDQLIGQKIGTLQGVDSRMDQAYGAQFDQTSSLIGALMGALR